jgi:hypothetical protein
MIVADRNRGRWMLDRLKKLTEHVLGITVLFYVLGFLVSTVYLCSLGVVWFDAIKPRYIVIGLLFGFFIMTFLLPLNVLRKHFIQGEIAKNFFVLLGVSFITLVVLSCLVFFIEGSLRTGVRADILARQPVGFDKAFTIEPQHFRSAIPMFYGIVLLLILAITVVASIVFRNDREKLMSFLRAEIPFIVALISYAILIEVLEVYRKLGPKNLAEDNGWNLFIITSLMTYVVGALFLFWSGVHKPKTPDPKAPPEAPTPVLDWSMSWVRLIWLSTYVSPILPVYATVVYPRIVQGIGGGAPVMVQLASADDQERPWTDKDSTYILERNDKDTLLLIKSAADGRIRIVEVESNKLGTIEYQDPGSSEAAR